MTENKTHVGYYEKKIYLFLKALLLFCLEKSLKAKDKNKRKIKKR